MLCKKLYDARPQRCSVAGAGLEQRRKVEVAVEGEVSVRMERTEAGEAEEDGRCNSLRCVTHCELVCSGSGSGSDASLEFGGAR